MTGGGFGGSTISVVKRGAEEDVASVLREAFASRFGRVPTAFVTSAVDGARRIG
jgi:galactokinase